MREMRSRAGSLRDDNVRQLCDSFCRGERLFAREWISVQAKGMTEEALIRISLSDDIPSRHPDNAPGQDHGLSLLVSEASSRICFFSAF